MPPVPIEKMEGPDLLAKHYGKVGITCWLLANIHKGELSKKKTITVKLKGAVNKKQLPKWCKVIATTGLTTYDKKGRVYYGDGETLLAVDLDALDIQQKARQDAQKNLGLTIDKLELGGPDGGPIPIVNLNELSEEIKIAAKELAKQYARTRKHKPLGSSGS